jgi:phosphatidylglycerol:prolipoprotein diacylglycerol transferase
MSENPTENNNKDGKGETFFGKVKTVAKKVGKAVGSFFKETKAAAKKVGEKITWFYTEKKLIAYSASAALVLLWLILFSIRVNNGVPDNMIDPVAFTLFGLFPIRWYGIIIVCGMIIALLLFIKLSKGIGLNDEDGITMFLICVPLGVLCARIGFVISHTGYYFPVDSFSDFVEIFAIWDGGVTILGAIPGGLFGVFLFARKKKVKFLDVVGSAAIPLLLAQAIGRWCNFPNQEVYGGPVQEGLKFFETFPFGVYIEAEGGWRYATFFYESVLSFIGVALLCVLLKKTKYRGTLAFGYLTWYFLSRALVESIRADAVFIGNSGLSWGVLMSLIVFPIAALLGVVYFQNGSLKRLSFKKLPEIEIAPPPVQEPPETEEPIETQNVKEKSEASKLSDYNKKYYGNKKK